MSQHQVKRKIMQDFYLFNADKVIKDTLEGCVFCTYSIVFRQPKHEYFHNKIPGIPRICYYFDLLGAMNTSGGNKWAYICVDAFSGYTILCAAKTKKAGEIQRFLMNSIICPLGCFKQIVMDGEISIDRSTNFQEFLDLYGITRTTTPVGSHHALGLCERIVGKTKEAIRKLTFQTHIEWHKIIGIVNSSINKTVLTYNVSAEKVLFGQDLNNIWSPLQFEVAVTDPDEYYDKIRQIVKEAQNVLRRNKGRKARENIAYINRKTKEKNFKENQIVSYSNLKIERGRGLSVKNTPCQIITKMRTTAYVKDLISGKYSKQHYSNMNEFKHNEDIELPENWAEEIMRLSNNNADNQDSDGTTPEPLNAESPIEQPSPGDHRGNDSQLYTQPETLDATEITGISPLQPSSSTAITTPTTYTSNLQNTIQRLLGHIKKGNQKMSK